MEIAAVIDPTGQLAINHLDYRNITNMEGGE